MRLLRALAHLVLALALIGAASAPARAGAFALPGAHASHDGMGHGSSGVHLEHAGHEHSPARGQPVHTPDDCQAVCCFLPSRLPPVGPDAVTIGCYGAVRYAQPVQPASGRTDAPEPGIPKVA